MKKKQKDHRESRRNIAVISRGVTFHDLLGFTSHLHMMWTPGLMMTPGLCIGTLVS